MLVITPRGMVSLLGSSAKSAPFSVPASQGKSCSSWARSQRPSLLSSGSPETPTNQSWLGAIMVVSVTRGCVLASSAVSVSAVVGPMLLVSPNSTPSVFAAAFRISTCRAAQPPISAIDSTPALARRPLSRKLTPALWTPPIRREKCAPPGRPPGVTAVLH